MLCFIIIPNSVGQTVASGTRAKNSLAKIHSEWAESCPYKGITAGCCQDGHGGLFEKLYAYNSPK